jgi:short-subunit dehydrogenase
MTMHLLVLGGNSDIGLAVAHAFASQDGASVTLASRDLDLLAKRARDLELRYHVQADAAFFDALDYDSHPAFYAGLGRSPDVVVAAFGLLGGQREGQRDFAEARRIIETNYLGAVSILEIAAADMERKGRGAIIGISSVAGERGRQSNYLYGSAKAGLTAYLGGLRHRLHRSGVQVMTVLPGFVRTKMTESLDLPDRLTAAPEEVARDIRAAFGKRRPVVYSKWCWRYIMLVIRSIPEAVFLRTKL